MSEPEKFHSKRRMSYKDFKEWARTGVNPRNIAEPATAAPAPEAAEA